jgi:transcriptional regulator with XRE-family HTH domain
MSVGESGANVALGLSEDLLAQALGIDPDWIEAYERATQRVPSEHLGRLSEVFGVPLSYFFPATPHRGL